MEIPALRKIIDKNWFQQVDEKHTAKWSFSDDLMGLDEEDFQVVINLCLECLDIPIDDDKVTERLAIALREKRSIDLEGIEISLELMTKVLICMTLSQYRLDALLLHPREMRYRELEEICSSVGLDQATVMKIDRNWQEKIRDRVYPQHKI